MHNNCNRRSACTTGRFETSRKGRRSDATRRLGVRRAHHSAGRGRRRHRGDLHRRAFARAYARTRSGDWRITSASVTRYTLGRLGTRHPVTWYQQGDEQDIRAARPDRRYYPTITPAPFPTARRHRTGRRVVPEAGRGAREDCSSPCRPRPAVPRPRRTGCGCCARATRPAATPHLDGLMVEVTEVSERLVLDGDFLDGLRSSLSTVA